MDLAIAVLLFGCSGDDPTDPAATNDTEAPVHSDSPPLPTDSGPTDTGYTDPTLTSEECWFIKDRSARPAANPDAPNFLLVVLDDVGIEYLDLYHSTVPTPTPTIDRLAEEGVVFNRAYATPLCSQTRAELMTGRLPTHTGIGQALASRGQGLSCLEHLAPAVLADHAGYYSALFGKWHLDTFDSGDLLGPQIHGFDVWAGAFANFDEAWTTDSLPQTYFDWERIYNAVPGRVSTYATTTNVNDAIAVLPTLPEPWLGVLAFNAAHAPYHRPPDQLTTLDPDVEATSVQKFKAAIEGMDTELGRLLETLDPSVVARTQVWVMGDNGSPEDIVGIPAKGSVYETGVHVPLIISGAGVGEPGRRSDHLVQAADFLPTATTLGSADVSAAWLASIDGVSIHAVLESASAPSARSTVWDVRYRYEGTVLHMEQSYGRGNRYKLVRQYNIDDPTDAWELYDMEVDGETTDLNLAPLSAEAQQAYDELVALRDTSWAEKPIAKP